MSGDRELLEWAAKAVGYIDDATTEGGAHGLHKGDNEDAPNPFYVVGPDGWVDWSPLTDDGDALRLAVKLGVVVGTYAYYTTVDLLSPNERIETVTVWHHETARDAYVAARRAIVRAAAEIGRAMP